MAKTSIDRIPFKTVTYGDLTVKRELAGYAPAYDHSIEWVDNVPFWDMLRFQGFERGRSAAHAVFVSQTNGMKYQVFLTDLEDMIRSDFWSRGVINTKFIGCKRGSNYGIRLDVMHSEIV